MLVAPCLPMEVLVYFTLLHGIDSYVLCRFNKMDPSISGRGAEPVYRDKIKGWNFSQFLFDVSVQCDLMSL